MIVDTFPQDSKRSARASSLSTSTSSPSSSTFVHPQPTIQAVQQNHDLPLDDDAPPPYESVTPTLASEPQSQAQLEPQPRSQPQAQPQATSIASRNSIRKSVDIPQPWSSEIDVITSTPESPHISPSNPTEHVAPSFLRPVPRPASDVTYERLPEPFVIDAKPGAVELTDSFAPWDMPPLHKHDVQKGDWEQLLHDVQNCAKLCGGQRIVSAVLPVTRRLGGPGHLASFFAAQGLKKQKTSDVAALLDVWNEKFFHPRRLEIILCRGDKRKSGSEKDIEFLAPDRMSSFYSSSSSSMSSPII